ncbi:hypothetical protein PtA15_6A633 [Puccinia triticina]|uniref:Uncharacterized protein n=1 Tax=Puccinia triticina TaxID=208348 RepID=A0ABY7CL98_9BASI|nr:uncharacterized protein PtA15_6A633 [Puccinia triticina]WAQ86003.1 hypothetical protein PtA15_6A633 [Puccinia triticina]WAR55900.1 hypothetical protein PtB15_6B644 [Puccinia triticina]
MRDAKEWHAFFKIGKNAFDHKGKLPLARLKPQGPSIQPIESHPASMKPVPSNQIVHSVAVFGAALETAAASSPPPEPMVAECIPTTSSSPTLLLKPTPSLPLSITIQETSSIHTHKLLEELGLSIADAEAINRLTTTFDDGHGHTASLGSPSLDEQAAAAIVVASAKPAASPAFVPEPVSTMPPDNNRSLAGVSQSDHQGL